MKPAWKQSYDTWLHASINSPKVANPTRHFPTQNWQFIIASLKQWLECFLVEPRADIWHWKRRSVSLPPPINRCDFHAPRGEKSGSKDSQKGSLPNSLQSWSPSVSLSLPLASTTAQPAKPPSSARPAKATPPPRQLFFPLQHLLHLRLFVFISSCIQNEYHFACRRIGGGK